MARQLRTQLEHEVTMEELARTSRTSQPATPPPPETAEAAAPSEPPMPHGGPELDLDRMVSGVEPTPPPPPHDEFGADAAADAAVAADAPPAKAAP
jgi:hypothetical protein